MPETWKTTIPVNFNDDSRIWIYQSTRAFTSREATEVEQMLTAFPESWLSHGAKVKGFAALLFNQFVVIMADEAQTGVSGCSTDSSVRVVKEIEQRFATDMFNRTQLAFLTGNDVRIIPMSGLREAAENGLIDPGTLYFNNTVLTKQDFLQNWLIPVGESWLANRISLSAAGK